MSREAFEACVNAFWDGDVGHLTPNDCLHAAWQAAQADAYERAAKVAAEHDVAPTDDPLGVQECIVDAIRALAKESK